jgi:hypothetical protein
MRSEIFSGRGFAATATDTGSASTTANSSQGSGTPFRRCVPRGRRSMPEPATRSRTVRETQTSPGPAAAPTRAPMCTARPAKLSPVRSHSPRVNARADVYPQVVDRVADHLRATNGACRPGQHAERPVSAGLDELTAGAGDVTGHQGVMAVVQEAPALVPDRCRVRGGADDVGEEHGREDAVRVAHHRVLTGHEPFKLMEHVIGPVADPRRLARRRQLAELRTWDQLPHSGPRPEAAWSRHERRPPWVPSRAARSR